MVGIASTSLLILCENIGLLGRLFRNQVSPGLCFFSTQACVRLTSLFLHFFFPLDIGLEAGRFHLLIYLIVS